MDRNNPLTLLYADSQLHSKIPSGKLFRMTDAAYENWRLAKSVAKLGKVSNGIEQQIM